MNVIKKAEKKNQSKQVPSRQGDGVEGGGGIRERKKDREGRGVEWRVTGDREKGE